MNLSLSRFLCYILNMDLDKQIGNRIKETRKKKGVKQSELAASLNIATITLRQYENGLRKISLDMIVRIAEALNVNPLYLFADAPEIGLNITGTTEEITYVKSLVSIVDRLNHYGKDKVINYASDLAENPKYQAAPPDPADQ